MTLKLVEVNVDATRTTIHLRLAGADGAFIDGLVTVVERDGITAFAGLDGLKDRIAGHRLDINVGLNRVCSAIFRGEAPALPLELEWPESGADD
ncbi:MAG: hypothetical protein BGP24_11620 [Lysobacterales bacterium 69-70]|nr:MAG: hypothetical protein ABS97_21385 [Xanthomonadaceae bacterium SCN 69-320]ODV22189.1 MAG: hypothetical protein ABT27_02765 [Xanthomonadaceae bacterium SCN 69-25]OJY98450.1 MAG: hypothetical protein BGP24_11620 [Xanthomonadales bacterium 69-70]